MVASPDNLPLLAELLAEQQRLDTPVARFSTAHDAGAVGRLAPQLIPLSQPGPGEQYAFEVDLDSCTGCKSCVAACHSLNGLDDTETWRDVGLLVSSRRAHPFTQTVTTACHHCADPACLNGCPVLAYDKDPVTGIVRHLDDQCIGCSYCVLKCPYDVPKYSERLGIVRKCDMCHSRLAVGEAPACAQACPTHAIRIVTVTVPAPRTENQKTSTVRSVVQENASLPLTRTVAPAQITKHDSVSGFPSPVSRPSVALPSGSDSGFLPAAPDAAYTRPTTRYVTKRKLPDSLIAGDENTLRVQPAHWPLVIMLTLMPTAVGFAAAGALPTIQLLDQGFALRLTAVITGVAGLLASVFHLGQPLRAWRVFLGWRKSWLSREAMVFGAWLPIAITAIFIPPLGPASALVGVVGVFCSAMIYIDTRRSFWGAGQTIPRFLGTSVLVGAAVVAPTIAALLLVLKVAWETRTRFDGSVSARLQRGPLRAYLATRDLLAVAAVLALIITPGPIALTFLLAGELAERLLFFRAVDAPKMPGLPSVARSMNGRLA